MVLGEPASSGAFGEQAEAAVEGRFHNALFFKNIGESPVAHHFGESVALANGVGHPRAHEGAVRDGGLVHIAGVELAPDERHVGVSGSGYLIMNFLDCSADHVRPGDFFMSAEDVFGLIVAVHVR